MRLSRVGLRVIKLDVDITLFDGSLQCLERCRRLFVRLALGTQISDGLRRRRRLDVGGQRLRRLIPEKPFRLMILILLLASGLNLIRRAIF